MPAARTFTELLFWQRARAWSKEIFGETRTAPFSADRRLVVQINDSSESVMANVAEGFGRGTQAQFIVFLGYALGSLEETKSHLCAAYDRRYIPKERFAALFREGTAIRQLIVAFIRAMIQPGGGARTLAPKPNWPGRVWEIYERLTGKPRPERFKTTPERQRPPRNDEPPL
jgi:four helix bundle protein